MIKKIVSLFLVAASAIFSASSPSKYTITGEIDTLFFDPTLQGLTLRCDFEVAVDGCNTRIRTWGGGDDKVEYFEHGSDGQQSYSLIKYKNSGTTQAINNGNMDINAFPLPYSNAGLIPPIWLSLASHCYYNTLKTDNIALPIGFIAKGFIRAKNTIRIAEKKYGESSIFLTKLVEYRDAYEYEDTTDGYAATPLPASFGKEVKNLEYQVLEWQGDFPSKFSFMRFMPDRKNNVMIPQQEFIGTVKTIKIGVADLVGFTNRTEPQTLIWDGRFYDPNGTYMGEVRYFSEDGKILTTEEVKTRPEYSDLLSKPSLRKPIQERMKRKTVLFAVAFILTTPVIFWLLKPKQTQKKHE